MAKLGGWRRWWLGVTWSLLLGLIPYPSALVPGVLHAQTTPGTIAYVRYGGEAGDTIRLIEPDGSNDRALWTVPVADPHNEYAIDVLDWRPDATELAFSSNHERACSIYASDIFTLRPDGSDLRRVSNGPLCDDLAGFPKGDVTVTVRNLTTKFGTTFYVHVQGAPGVVEVVVPHNGTATVTLPAVADFGDMDQRVIVLQSAYRWDVGTVDVQPGTTVTATPNPAPAVGDGTLLFGAWGPSWRSDGTRIGYARSGGSCLGVAATPAMPAMPGAYGEFLITNDEIVPCSMAWGPTPALANDIVFQAAPNLGMDGATFYLAQEGDAASDAERLFALGSTTNVLWYDWAKDGTSLLFVRTTKFGVIDFVESNLFEYEFATGTITQLTTLTDEFVRSFDTSPDGKYIVFERAASRTAPESDVWIMDRNGENLRLLVENGRIPNWSSQTAAEPPPLPDDSHALYVPSVLR